LRIFMQRMLLTAELGGVGGSPAIFGSLLTSPVRQCR
jgi:hypothetical protein